MSSTTTEVLREPGITANPKSLRLLNYQRPDPASSHAQQCIPLPRARSKLPTVLEKDKDTPDSHVRRDGRLIRLTGVHPFNAEAPLTPLYKDGKSLLDLRTMNFPFLF